MNSSESRFPPILPIYFGSLIVFFLLRVLFWVYNYDLFHVHGSGEVVTAFVNGIMIDSSVAATALMAVLIVYALIRPVSASVALRVLSVLGISLVALFFLVNLIDIVYFEVYNSRLNILLLDNLGQMSPILKTVFHNYPVYQLLAVWAASVALFVALLRILTRFLHFSTLERYPKSGIAGMFVLMFLLSFLWTGQPFWRMNRFSLRDQGLTQLSLNGVYTVVKAYDQKRDLERHAGGVAYRYEPTAEAVREMQNIVFNANEVPTDDVFPFARRIRDPKPLKVSQPNVVIILMEGFTASYIGALNDNGIGYSPGFDSLARNGLLFTNFYGQGVRTHYGLVSTVGSFPSVLNMFLTRRRGTESFYTLGNVFRDYGYNTSFIYGYDQGFDHMGFFMKQGGIDRVIDRKDFVDPVKFEAEWGVSDEDLFVKADRYFSGLPSGQPFFSVLLTSSNHSPFEVPEDFIEAHPEYVSGEHEASFAYADYCLSQFIRSARKKEYFDRTIFVMVADHGEICDSLDREFKRFQIPCLIYAPALITRPEVISTVGSQVDIGTTLMHLIGFPGVFHFLGRDLLSLKESEGWAIMRSDNTVYCRKGDRVLVRDIRDTLSNLYQLDSNSRLLTDHEISDDSLEAELNHKLETYLQVAHYLYSTGKHRYSLGDRAEPH